MCVDEFLNRGLELRHAAEGAPTDLLHREFGKPPFHEAEPRSIGRRDARETAAAWRTSFGSEAFCACLVVHDEMHVEPPRDARLDQVEKLTERCGPMSLMELSDHVKMGVW